MPLNYFLIFLVCISVLLLSLLLGTIVEKLFFFLFAQIKLYIIKTFSRSWSEEPEEGFDHYLTEEELYSPYPQQYSLYLDYLLPYTIFLTSFWPIFLHISWEKQLFVISFNYLFLLIPFLTFWSKIRAWEPLPIIYTFSKPMAFKHIIIGVIYPLFYVIFLGAIRYLAIGNVLYFNLFLVSITNFIYLIFLIPYFLIIFLYLVKKYAELRYFLVQNFKLCFHSIYVYSLRNATFMRFCRNVHKYDFAAYELFRSNSSLNAVRKLKYPFILKFTEYVWIKNPKILYLLIPLFMLSELVLRRNLYYWFYFLFMFFCLRLIFITFRKFTHDIDMPLERDFVGDCNKSNYLNEKSWKNPYYPSLFAHSLRCENEIHPNRYISPSKIEEIEKLAQIVPYVPFSRYYKKTNKHFPDVLGTKKLPLFRKIKLLYPYIHQQRWIHTSSFVYNTRRWVYTSSSSSRSLHPMLPYLLQDVFSKLGMVTEAHNWRTLYSKVQQAEKDNVAMCVPKLYTSALPHEISQHQPVSTTIKALTEYNTLTAFSCLLDKGVVVGPHQSFNVYNNSLRQTDPDVSLTVNNLNKQLLLGFDMKVNSTESGANLILGVSKEEYAKIILRFIYKYRNHGAGFGNETLAFLNKLQEIDDVEERMFLYRENMHWFENLQKYPPINLGKMVYEEHFSADYKAISFSHKLKLVALSDFCYKKEPFKGNSLRQQTLNLFKDPDVSAIKKDIKDMLP